MEKSCNSMNVFVHEEESESIRTAFEAHSSFVKDCVGGDTKSDAEERDVDDGTDDMQGDLSTENSCEKLQEGDISILCEDDIPGSSLNGKNPNQLNMTQLKRWLACRGAPVSGRKPELIERVQCYINYGWDQYLVDPDKGANIRRKLAASQHPKSLNSKLLCSFPSEDDPQWSNRLYKIPEISFSTIYDFLVDRKVLLKRVSYLECVADKRAEEIQSHTEGDCTDAEMVDAPEDQCEVRSRPPSDVYVPVEYTRTLDKAYRFYKDGHVQEIRYHPMLSVPGYICISAKVLPSMRKDRVYHVSVIIKECTSQVMCAYCACPAGLSGCCNHITATLYCLEDYFHLGLHEDEKKGCTDRLQTWNQPRKRCVEARPTDDVKLTKEQYGAKKNLKIHRVNKWDCRPLSRRIVNPDKIRKLHERLSTVEQNKIMTINTAIREAETSNEKKKAIQAKLLLTKYGSSCFMQLLDNEPSPKETHLDEIKTERLARAAAAKKIFQEKLSAQAKHVGQDHSYARSAVTDAAEPECDMTEVTQPHLVTELYTNHVVVNPDCLADIEESTRSQSASELWFKARKFRITASIMKEVCHRKSTTSCRAFIQTKLSQAQVTTAAISYGRQHENEAILSYVRFKKSQQINVKVNKCGLIIDSIDSWLAASPDGIVLDPTQQEHQKGCLEVKCPYVCRERMTITDACRQVSAFCLVEHEGLMCLSESHKYFYQIQTQMHVSKFMWCDFVVWCPQQIFVQRVYYNAAFMSECLLKAKKFYFEKFLPSLAPYMIIKNSQHAINKIAQDSRDTTTTRDTATAQDTESDLHTRSRVSESSAITKSVVGKAACTTMSPAVSSSSKCVDTHAVQIIGETKASTVSIQTVLQHLNIRKHAIKGDGDCLYHSVAHQAGLVPKHSQGDQYISQQLRKVALSTMLNHDDVRKESGLSVLQWKQKRQEIVKSGTWGGDTELRLLAIGIQRDIVVITAQTKHCYTFARKFICQPPPVPKMRGGIFIPLTSSELCTQWNTTKPLPLVILYNGQNHFDSTVHL